MKRAVAIQLAIQIITMTSIWKISYFCINNIMEKFKL